nr:hypothetical protein GCM10025732_13440 [Glycomyces mayteni]
MGTIVAPVSAYAAWDMDPPSDSTAACRPILPHELAERLIVDRIVTGAHLERRPRLTTPTG